MSERPHHRFLSLAVRGGTFLDGFRLDLTAGVNCFIGGTGSGKTTALELLSFAVQSAGAPVSAHVRDNLGAGTLIVTLETTHGVRYVVERSIAEGCRVLDESGKSIPVAIDQLVPIDYFRVHSIEEMGKDATSQLQLIDRFAADDMRELDGMVAAVKRTLVTNAAEQSRLHAAALEKRDDAAAVAVLEQKLKGLAIGQETRGLTDANAASTLRQQERHAVTTALQSLAKTHEENGRFSALLARRFFSVVDDALLAGPNGDLLSRVAAHVATARSQAEAALRALSDACETAEQSIRDRERSLVARHHEQDAAYQVLLTQAKEEAGRADERKLLQQKLASALASRKHLEQVDADRRGVDQKHAELFARLLELRDRRFARRKQIADDLSRRLAPNVVVQVKQNADKELFRKLLNERLKNSKMQYGKVVDKLVDALTPDELAGYLRRDDAGELAERAGLDEDRARKVMDRLGDCETVCEIEIAEMDDKPVIKLLDGTYKEISGVSTGQRCTAILPIVLLESVRPLMIDQPEDDLEGAFLCEVIIKSVRAIKSSRQITFASHSPNIVVLSDSERVHVLASDGRAGRLVAAGTVDEMRSHIQAVLEGGAVAFAERMKRYGY